MYPVEESEQIVTQSSGYNDETKDEIAEFLSKPLDELEIKTGDQLIKKMHPLADQKAYNLFKLTKELKHCLCSNHQKKNSRGKVMTQIAPKGDKSAKDHTMADLRSKVGD